MKIRDLPNPVTASKADWLSGSIYLGFTPVDGSIGAKAKCESTIQRQFGSGYVIEYVTEKFGEPNQGFNVDSDRDIHAEHAGKFIAVHKIRHSSRPLVEIVGKEEFENIQNIWAKSSKRFRWSVAFPIIETYRVEGMPKARDVLGPEAYLRLYAHPSAVLRPLDDEHRSRIADLEIVRQDAINAYIALEDEFEFAERSDLSGRLAKLINIDLDSAGWEGETDERSTKVRRRAAWLANKFWMSRVRHDKTQCDLCHFDPKSVVDGTTLKIRSIMDVHHTRPLEEGRRYTTIDDFALLCPTCHRLEHMHLRNGGSLL